MICQNENTPLLPTSVNRIESEQEDSTNEIKNDSKKKASQDTTRISGIYKIVNRVNGKYYVGSSQDILGKRGRWWEHKRRLRKNEHHNTHLQRAWNKYGEANFEFIIIENVPVEGLFEAEQRHLDLLISNRKNAYNQAYDAYSSMRGKKHTAESRQRISDGLKGNKCRLGIKHSDADRIKCGNAFRGKTQSSSHVKSRMIGCKGKRIKFQTEESKRRISESLKDTTFYKWFNPKLELTEILTPYDFRTKYGIYHGLISRMIHGKQKSTNGWLLTHV